MKIQDKNILISGGSRGLGLALAHTLAKRSAHVVLVAREPVALGAAVKAIRSEGGRAHAIAADVGDPNAASSIAAKAAALAGPIDILINNASELGQVPLPLLLD